MPRMPKYLKREWAFFLDERGRKKYNELCRKCERSCKQSFRATVIEAEQVRYEPAHEVHKTMLEIEGMGQKTITGKIAVSKDDYQQLTALAKEGITSRGEIQDLKSSVSYYQRQYFNASSAVERLQERYDRLKEKCQPFLQALEHFPKLVEVFVEKVKELFSIKEAQERKEREDRAAARKEQSKHRRGRNDWER